MRAFEQFLLVILLTFSACSSTNSTQPQPLPSEYEQKMQKCLQKKELEQNLNNINDSLKQIANIPFINSQELNNWNEMNGFIKEMMDMFGLHNQNEEDECAGIELDESGKRE